jgi:hypothetical protein
MFAKAVVQSRLEIIFKPMILFNKLSCETGGQGRP